MKESNIITYYNAICEDLQIKPVRILFCNVAKGGACITHNTKGKISNIQIDLKRCKDIEYALLHETAHQILITKNNNFSHNATFKRLEKKLVEKYLYSGFSSLLYK